MKLLIFCIILGVVWLGSSSPIEPNRYIIKRFKSFRDGQKDEIAYSKGHQPGVKRYNPTRPPHLAKGQYMCGNKVCKLQPGEIPQGCNGVCQYAVS